MRILKIDGISNPRGESDGGLRMSVPERAPRGLVLTAFRGEVKAMRVITICAVLCAAAAYGGTASIVSSFRSPSSAAYGIDYYDGYLYHADRAVPYIYQTTMTGSLVKSIRVSAPYNPAGIDRTQDGFWTCSYNPPWVYRLSTTGAVLNSFPAWERGWGITFGEDSLWYTQLFYIFKVTTGGSIMRSFVITGINPAGICWDNPYLWIAGYSTHQIYKITQTGSIVDSANVKGGPTYGITCDDPYLWYTANYYVYQIRFSPTAVAPASLGKVKAIYR